MELVREETIRSRVSEEIERQTKRIRAALPDVDVQHIGATAVPGSLTKGDVDLLVRVPKEGFDASVWRLTDLYSIHQIENWDGQFASFTDPESREIPVGIQLVVLGSEGEREFLTWRDLLRAEPEIQRRYDQFKEGFAGSDENVYRRAKEIFIRSTLWEQKRRGWSQ